MILQSHSWLKKTISQKDTRTPVSPAALFTSANMQAIWISIDRRMDKDVVCMYVVYIHNRILLNHKKLQNNAVWSNMDVTEMIILSEAS